MTSRVILSSYLPNVIDQSNLYHRGELLDNITGDCHFIFLF